MHRMTVWRTGHVVNKLKVSTTERRYKEVEEVEDEAGEAGGAGTSQHESGNDEKDPEFQPSPRKGKSPKKVERPALRRSQLGTQVILPLLKQFARFCDEEVCTLIICNIMAGKKTIFPSKNI